MCVVEWRGRALAEFPELRSVIEHEAWSCHVFFIELLDLVRDAHRRGDVDLLRRAYGFAQWCLEQPGGFLSNAAVVSFYEHAFDEWELRDEVARWLPAQVAQRARPLWEWRLPADRLAEVDRLLSSGDHPG
ncbi:hypothetical protein GTS_27910 [Gandjariella thermophila]|uniref:DUF7674 domain-containing protein n=1 Tax=Gandjariella thermophila TaxID=1931992 RepID=A0A4D4J917_9PSEU|nr:hypothetical protein GTS_27910 [Gandjariella thermophila]